MERPELESRSAAFAAAVFALCQAVRQHPGARSPSDQLVDAASSVGANYRSSSRSRSRREFVAKIAVVAEEADEAVFWLEFFATTGLGDHVVVERLLAEGKELRAIFAASYRTSRRGRKT
jgi:four helix bundle protein